MRYCGVATLLVALVVGQVEAFAPIQRVPIINSFEASQYRENSVVSLSNQAWDGEVVSNEGGTIRGCSLTPVGDSVTEWTVTIDG